MTHYPRHKCKKPFRDLRHHPSLHYSISPQNATGLTTRSNLRSPKTHPRNPAQKSPESPDQTLNKIPSTNTSRARPSPRPTSRRSTNGPRSLAHPAAVKRTHWLGGSSDVRIKCWAWVRGRGDWFKSNGWMWFMHFLPRSQVICL